MFKIKLFWTYKLPFIYADLPIPIPPATISPPVDVDVESVVFEKVLTPANVCVPVVTSPRFVPEALGMFKVWVSILEEMFTSVPELPKAIVCKEAVRLFIDVIPALIQEAGLPDVPSTWTVQPADPEPIEVMFNFGSYLIFTLLLW